MINMGIIIRKIVERNNIKKPILTFGKAIIQDGQGSKLFGTEAAHNIPRDVLINNQSMWSYLEDRNFHPRIKKLIYLTAAATVIVKKEVNYIDSQWEKNGLLDVFGDYLEKCLTVEIDTDNESGLLANFGRDLLIGCGETFSKTEAVIKTHKVYAIKPIEISKIILDYKNVLNEFDHKYFIDTLLSNFKLPQYR
jgi:hypothetical protein